MCNLLNTVRNHTFNLLLLWQWTYFLHQAPLWDRWKSLDDACTRFELCNFTPRNMQCMEWIQMVPLHTVILITPISEWIYTHTHTHTHTYISVVFHFIFILHECIPILGSPEFVWVKLTGLERSFYTRDIHCLPFYCPIHHWIMDHHSFLMMGYLPEIDIMTTFIDVTTLASK